MYNQQRRIDVFQRQYRVYTGAYFGKNELDEMGKIMLPPSALDELAGMHLVYPLLFEIENTVKKIKTHSGVLEFNAQEGYVIVPYWMLEHLQLKIGQIVVVKSATLPKGTYVKLRPQQKAFIDISDPKAVLEAKLRTFSCLTKGDTIMINYNNKSYCIDIMEVGSKSGLCSAISIVETDVEVDFDRPADMPLSPVEERPGTAFPAANTTTAASTSASSGGGGMRIGGSAKPTTAATGTSATAQPAAAAAAATAAEPPKSNFAAFAGQGRRLDGKPAASVPAATASTSSSSSAASSSTATTTSAAKPTTSTATPAAATAPKPSSGLVFGGGSLSGKPTTAPTPTPAATTTPAKPATTTTPAAAASASSSATPASATPSTAATAKKEEEPKFVPFKGQGRSLK